MGGTPSTSSGGGFDINTPLRPVIQPTDFPISFDFTTVPLWSVDLQSQQSRAVIDIVQTMFIDNRSNNSEVQLVLSVTNQRFSVPAAGYAYLPVLMPNPPKFTVQRLAGAAAETTIVHLLNVPLPAVVWAPTSIQSFQFDGSGFLETDDVGLNAFFTALLNSGSLAVVESVFGSGDVVKPHWIGDELFTTTGLTAAATTAIIAAAAGQTFFITDVEVYLSGDATLAAAGELVVTLKDDTVAIATGIARLPNAIPAAPNARIDMIHLTNINYNGKVDANDLNITIGTALTNGKVVYNIAGGLTGIVGP